LQEDERLPDGTALPAHSLLMYAAYLGNRSRKVWGPDARDFRCGQAP
jgi:hypothetical protein